MVKREQTPARLAEEDYQSTHAFLPIAVGMMVAAVATAAIFAQLGNPPAPDNAPPRTKTMWERVAELYGEPPLGRPMTIKEKAQFIARYEAQGREPCSIWYAELTGKCIPPTHLPDYLLKR